MYLNIVARKNPLQKQTRYLKKKTEVGNIKFTIKV